MALIKSVVAQIMSSYALDSGRRAAAFLLILSNLFLQCPPFSFEMTRSVLCQCIWEGCNFSLYHS